MMAMTTYVVLEYVADSSYREAWRGEAHSARGAVKAAAKKLGLTEGKFVAVPKRSFEQVEITVETVQRVRVN